MPIPSRYTLLGVAVRDRWRIIRGSYVRYLRSLDSETQAPKKEYYLAKYMEFVRPFLKIRESLGPATPVRQQDTKYVYTLDVNRLKTEKESAKKTVRTIVQPTTTPTPNKKRRLVEEDEDEVADELFNDLEDSELHEIDEQEEVEIEEQPTGGHYYDDPSGAATYTLRNGQLVDSKAEIVMQNQNTTAQPMAATSRPEEDNHPDLLFLKSLLPDMATLTNKKKNKFKSIITTTLCDLMDD